MRCVLLLLLLGLVLAASESIETLFSDATTSQAFRYDMKDSAGQQMACVHAYESRWPGSGSRYYSVYQSLVGTEFDVRLARSDDLMHWTFVRTLLSNADMPFISFPAEPSREIAEVFNTSAGFQPEIRSPVNSDGWILLTHEQWMKPNSRAPSQLDSNSITTKVCSFPVHISIRLLHL